MNRGDLYDLGGQIYALQIGSLLDGKVGFLPANREEAAQDVPGCNPEEPQFLVRLFGGVGVFFEKLSVQPR